MKSFYTLLILVGITISLKAQVSISIDNSSPDPSAMLDVKSQTKGVLLPRVSLSSLSSPSPIVNPAVGLMVYNTANAGTPPLQVVEGYYHWSGTQWIPVSTAKGSNRGDMQYWNGNQWVTIPVGLPGQYLQLSSDKTPTWTGSTYSTITTLPVTDITANSCKTGGVVADNGGSPVIGRGVCWNESGNPTIADQKIIEGAGTGNFIITITGLQPLTKYYIRAFATNNAGTAYGNEVTCLTFSIPVVSTDSVTEILQNSVNAWGKVWLDGGTPVTESGFCWASTANPSINDNVVITGSGTGQLQTYIESLQPNTTYYLRAFATNAIGTAYGQQFMINTLPPAVLPVVTTAPVTSVTTSSASSGGEVLSDGYSPVTARGVCWSLTPLPTISDPKTTDGSGIGTYTSSVSGLMADTIYYIRAYATNSVGTAYGTELTFRTLFNAPVPCPGIPTVSYEGKTYSTVQIGSQCWLKENLNVGLQISGTLSQTDNSVVEKYCLFNLDSNCTKFGGLYQWNEAMQYVPVNGTKGICPTGWHLPTYEDFIVLINHQGGEVVSGGKLKQSGTSHWVAPNTGATNRSGFTALPGAFRMTTGAFYSPGYEADFWSSTSNASGFTGLWLTNVSDSARLSFFAEGGLGYSVRCIKDTCSTYSQASVSITPSANQICVGTQVTFTAVAVNGGPNPFFQWTLNGNKTGSNSATYTYLPSNGDVVGLSMFSGLNCVTNPATANPVTMIVNTPSTVGVVITAAPNPVCAGIQTMLNATGTNGGTLPVYQWNINGNPLTGATTSAYSYIPSSNDILTCTFTSNAGCVSGNPATSNTVTMTVNPLQNVSVSISASANNICAGQSVTYTATPANGGTNPLYQWKKNGNTISGATNVTYTYAPVNNDIITCQLTSNIACAAGSPATSNAITMTVTTLSAVSVSIVATATVVCPNTTVTFTATPVNGGTTPQYQWRKNTVNISGATLSTYSYIPTNNDIISCVLTSNVICPSGSPATSNNITMTVNTSNAVNVSISATATTVCSGTSVTFTANPTNGGTTPAYQWKKGGVSISGATNVTYAYTPAQGDLITCQLTSNVACPTGNPATSNVITMTVTNPLPVSVSITASGNNVCSGANVTFTATPVNGGTSPAYQWKKGGSAISGATAATYAYVPINGDVITCTVTSNATCVSGSPATSNAITMTVIASSAVSLTISTPLTTLCSGSSATYTAAPVNGGTTPGYQWMKGSANITGATNVTYSYTPANGDVISCTLTSNIACATGSPATSNAITMAINAPVAVGVTISPSANNVCEGTSVTFTATPANGGTSPAYQWKKGGTDISGATNVTYAYTPVSGDVITCQLTSNASCVTGNPALSSATTMTVTQPLPVSVSISASANNICAGTNVTFTATPTNGGTTPAYQWKKGGVNISGATAATYSYAPANNDVITCTLTSNATCISGNPATSAAITMAVTANSPVSISIAASGNNICAGTQVTFTATPVNGGTAPAYQWVKGTTNISGATNATYTYTPVNGEAITCRLTSNIVCPSGNPATSNGITMIVNPLLTVSVSIVASSNPSCNGSNVTFTATPVNGGTTPVYQWKVNGSIVTSATNSTYTFIPTNGNTVQCLVTSNATCPSGSPATSNTITMTVDPLQTISVSVAATATTVCAGTSVTFTATPTNGGTSPAYQWIVNGNNVSGATSSAYSYAPVNGDLVKCQMTSSVSCPSVTPAISNVITMTVNPANVVSVTLAASAYAVVTGTSVTFTATPTNGGTAPYYVWKKNGVTVGGNTNTYSYAPANNDNVYCIMTSSLTTCVTGSPATSNTVNMIVYTSGTACNPATVTHGGQTYNTVVVGTQCWLRENLNIGTMITGATNQTNNSIIEKFCFLDDPNYCNVYGGLYQWGELVQYLNNASNTTHWNPAPTGVVQGLCPTGFHIPTNSELTTLFTFLGGITVAGGKLKEIAYVHWNSPNTSAGNTYGFTALPHGNVYQGVFQNLRQYGHHWTASTGTTGADAYIFGCSYNSSSRVWSETAKINGYGVRCIKD